MKQVKITLILILNCSTIGLFGLFKTEKRDCGSTAEKQCTIAMSADINGIEYTLNSVAEEQKIIRRVRHDGQKYTGDQVIVTKQTMPFDPLRASMQFKNLEQMFKEGTPK